MCNLENTISLALVEDAGPLEARARMKMKVQEWMDKNLVRQRRGRRVLTVAREEAMGATLKTLRANKLAMGRWAVRAALLEVVADDNTMVEVGVSGGQPAVSRWATTALQWAVQAGWMQEEEAKSIMDSAATRLRVVDPQAPVFLELGMGWAGLTDPAMDRMKAEGGRVVTMDQQQCNLGSRGMTQPDILGKFQGRKKNLIQHCADEARFAMEALIGVPLSLNCLEESKGNHLPNGKGPHQGQSRTDTAEIAITEAIADLREWAEGGEGRFYMVEQPGGSALEGDPRMEWMGAPLQVTGCTYGLKHRKDYLLWTNLSSEEFMVHDPKDFCMACRVRGQHEQGLIPARGSQQQRVCLPGYSIKAARNRIPYQMGDAIVEGFWLARQRENTKE